MLNEALKGHKNIDKLSFRKNAFQKHKQAFEIYFKNKTKGLIKAHHKSLKLGFA